MSDALSSDWVEQEGVQPVAAPPSPSDPIAATIAEWDAMSRKTRPTYLLPFVKERTGLDVPEKVWHERMYICGQEFNATGQKVRAFTKVDPEHYGMWLDEKFYPKGWGMTCRQSYEKAVHPFWVGVGQPIVALRLAQKFFLDHVGIALSHGQLNTYVKKTDFDDGDPGDQALLIREWLRTSEEVRRLVTEGSKAARRGYVSQALRDTQKELDSHVQAMKAAESPLLVGFKAARELYESAQYVHAIGKSLGDMPGLAVEQVEEALEDLDEQTSLVLKEIAAIKALQNAPRNAASLDTNMVVNGVVVGA